MTNVSDIIEENKGLIKRPLRLSDKYMLNIPEASAYFNIGQNRLRSIVPEHLDSFGILNGNRFLIIREKFEEYLQENDTI